MPRIAGLTSLVTTLFGAPFGDYMRSISGLSPQWNLQETSGSVAGAWNRGVALGRQLAINCEFANGDDGAWAKTGTATIAVGAASWTAGAGTISQTPTLVIGKTYTITFTITNYVAGNVRFLAGSAVVGTYRGANDTYTETGVVPDGVKFWLQSDTNFIGDVTLASVKQTDILASSAYGTPGDNPLDGADTATTVGVATGLASMPYARRFNGATSYIDITSTEYNSILDPATFSAFIFAKPSWDANERDFFSHIIDANNYIRVGQSATAGTARWEIMADGNLNSRTLATGAPVNFSLFGISCESGVMKAIYNGVQVGADIALVGTVIGNFLTMIIGARNDTPTNVVDGDMMQYDSANRALTSVEWSDIDQRSGI